MAKKTEHPICGRLIPDQSGQDLMCFRKFLNMKVFWHPDSKKQLQDLEPQHRDLVKKWEQQPGELPQYCRNFDVLAALQSLGVYEVGFLSDDDSQDAPPTAAQVAAWEDFQQHESEFCQEACAAIVRYYKHLREIEPELFEGEADCPETAESIKDLQACVRFDGMSFSPEVVAGVSTISFGWDVDWDMEHGLQMLFHDRKVIAIGNELYGPEDVLSEANFWREQMSPEEESAWKSFAGLIEQS